jgi:hypothetical protein
MENTIEVTNLTDSSKPTFEYLQEKYKKLFYKLAIQVNLDVDDVVNTAYLIHRTDENFDASKGNYEARFIFLLRHEIFKEYRSFEEELTEEFESILANKESEELECWRTDETLAEKNLGGDLNKIAKLLLDGHDFEYCAEKLGLTLRRIEQICNKAQKINKDQKDLFREVA